MTRMPGALWLPISRNYTNRRRARTNACILHVDAGNAHSLRGWFNNPAARASSHLHVRKDGVIEQYIDLDLISWANRQGDQRAVTVETQGRDGEPWTSAQLASLARILAFVNSHYGVPLTMMTNSRTSTSGVGWHRLGIDGNFGGLPYPANLHRVSGGESWSGARGKTCPGTDRILQIPNLIKTAAGGTPETPKEPLMSARDYWRWVGQDFVNKNATSKDFQLARAYQRSNQIWSRIRSTAFRNWLARGTWRNFRGQDFVNKDATSKDFQLARAYQYSYENNGKLDRLLAAVEGMSAGLDEALGEDRSHIYEAVRAALEDHDQRQVQVDVNITDAPQDDDDQALILAGDDDPTGDDSDHDQEGED